jgi:hypothetical protein
MEEAGGSNPPEPILLRRFLTVLANFAYSYLSVNGGDSA